MNKSMVGKKLIQLCVFGMTSLTPMIEATILLTRPWETLLRPEIVPDHTFVWWTMAEAGFDFKAYNDEGERVNPMRIWSESQNSLGMLNGFESESAIGRLRSRVDADNDGVRGHICFTGDLDYRYGVSTNFRWMLPHNFSLALYVPFYSMSLKNVCWQDQTKMILPEDFRVKDYLTNHLAANVKKFGCLELCDWERSGLGDIALFGDWLRDFPQAKPFLKNVRLNGRLGATFPTGKREDEDKLLAFAFGTDGGFGLVFGGGVDLTFADYFRGGLDVELNHVFGSVRNRRIKTDRAQTELLLLQKVNAYKDFGLLQRFNLYLELYRFFEHLSFKVGYQFMRHDEDKLSFANCNFSQEIANTAVNLEEWTAHYLFFIANIDCWHRNERRVHPYFSVYAKVPFNGELSMAATSIGIQLSFDF